LNNPIHIKVECYSGYRGEETPRRIQMANSKIEVRQILDRWLSPDYRYFKFRGDDDAVYIIRHDGQSGIWELTFYRAATQSLPGSGDSAEQST